MSERVKLETLKFSRDEKQLIVFDYITKTERIEAQ